MVADGIRGALRPLDVVVRWALGSAVAVVSVPAAYLGVVTVAGARPPRRAGARRDPTTRFAVLVPAHDEAPIIGEALRAFQALQYPRDRFGVHVVADNCHDDTAAVVRGHGWEAHERDAPDDPGKGPALNWLFDRLVARGEPFDAIVVVDADTTLDPQFLTVMDEAIRGGADVAQGWYSVRDPEASPVTSFRFAALACRHHLRPLGRCRLGGSSGLYGNGMVFTREVMEGRRWSGHLVEDAEFQLELLMDGRLVRYEPGARLWAEMPEELDIATSQNARWERGRLELARRFTPRLLRGLVERRDRRAVADAILDLVTPPLSVLVAAQLALVGATSTWWGVGRRGGRPALLVVIGGLVAVGAHVMVGLRGAGASTAHYRALASAPRIAWWKVRLWWSAATTHDVTWTRTRRNVERAEATT